MRTLWVCNVSGGPFQYTAVHPGSTLLGLEEAHRDLKISPEEFDEVAAVLARTLDEFNVRARWLARRREPRDRGQPGQLRPCGTSSVTRTIPAIRGN
jgi:hypothetical protein